MTRAFLHGFLGGPAVWDGIAAQGDVVVDLHREPVLATWDANLVAIGARIAGCDGVVGYSLGARIALGLVAGGHAPRALLVSVNPGIPDEDRAARRAADAAWAQRFRSEPLAAVLDAWEAQPLFATQQRAGAERLAARRRHRLALDAERLARSLEVMGLAEMPDHRGAVTAERCTLVAGADDAKFLAIARALPAPLVVIDACGHDPLLEQPARLAVTIADWADTVAR